LHGDGRTIKAEQNKTQSHQDIKNHKENLGGPLSFSGFVLIFYQRLMFCISLFFFLDL